MEEGRDEQLIRQICRKLKKGKDVSIIAEELEEDDVRIRKICESLKSFAPDYDEDRAIEVLQCYSK